MPVKLSHLDKATRCAVWMAAEDGFKDGLDENAPNPPIRQSHSNNPHCMQLFQPRPHAPQKTVGTKFAV